MKTEHAALIGAGVVVAAAVAAGIVVANNDTTTTESRTSYSTPATTHTTKSNNQDPVCRLLEIAYRDNHLSYEDLKAVTNRVRDDYGVTEYRSGELTVEIVVAKCPEYIKPIGDFLGVWDE